MGVLKSVGIGVVLLAAIITAAVWAQPSTAPSPAVSVSATPTPAQSPVTTTSHNNMHEITISTTLGDIVFQTYDADAPKAANNFITLAGKGFYNNLTFHRVISGFMIQGGDPTGTGAGGPGYAFEDELASGTESYQKGYVRGTVAMANSGPNTNGSQFFIMHKDYPLPHNYTIFGHVVRGQDVVDKVATVKTDANDKPLTPVVMMSVKVKTLQ